MQIKRYLDGLHGHQVRVLLPRNGADVLSEIDSMILKGQVDVIEWLTIIAVKQSKM